METLGAATTPDSHVAAHSAPADELFAKVKDLLDRLDGRLTDTRVAGELQVTKKQAEVWLKRFADEKLRELFENTGTPRTVAELVEELRFSERHIRGCLKRLVDEGVVEKPPRSRPLGYRSSASIGPLFDQSG
ncbi:MAG: hypothetical protein OXC08_16240 [Thiotrichales bacterium]|nr:hypothetical protein [Thiotrichales bacterium]